MHREHVKARSVRKYAENQKHKEDVKLRSKRKYKADKESREKDRKRGLQRYTQDKKHKEKVKLENVQRYKNNTEYRANTKLRSKEKYATDTNYKMLITKQAFKDTRKIMISGKRSSKLLQKDITKMNYSDQLSKLIARGVMNLVQRQKT